MSWRNRLLIVFFAFFCQLFAFAGQTFFLCSAASGSVYGPFEKKPGTIISIHGRDWAIIASELITSEMSKFIVAVVSVTQLLYLSEVGGLILGSKIPVKLWEMFVIFLERTIISLLIACPLAHLLF